MRLLFAALVAALVLVEQHALGQGRPDVLEQVIVTAQHREASAQSTPISLFTMNAEQLEKQRVDSIADLNGLVPNLSIDAFPGE